MTGGFAFVFDRNYVFVDHYNHELVDIHHIDTEQTGNHRNLLYRMRGSLNHSPSGEGRLCADCRSASHAR
ncbi:MAG TPA: hypothetical protein VM011_03555 [Gammaproteobacteria bacterium]|nr:hypothetical protein [Gammaproteobacteria bacterium]